MYTNAATLTEHQDTVNCLTFSDDGLYLASGDDSGVVLVCETQDPRQFDRYYFTDSVTSLLWIPGTKSLYAGLANCELHYLSLEDELVYRMDFRPAGYKEMSPALWQLAQINCLAFDPIHSWVAIGVGVTTIVISIRDFTKNKFTELCTITPGRSSNRRLTHGQSPQALSAEVRSLHFTPSSRQIMITTLEEGIRCFGVRDLTEKWRIDSHSYRIGRSALNIQGTLIVCSNLFNGFDVYDVETRSYICTLPQISPEHINVSLPVLFVHEDREILTGSAQGQVQVRPFAENGGNSYVLDHNIIQAIAYTQIASKSYIATACSEKGPNTYVKLWARSPMAKQASRRRLVSRGVSTEPEPAQIRRRNFPMEGTPAQGSRQTRVVNEVSSPRSFTGVVCFMLLGMMVTFTGLVMLQYLALEGVGLGGNHSGTAI